MQSFVEKRTPSFRTTGELPDHFPVRFLPRHPPPGLLSNGPSEKLLLAVVGGGRHQEPAVDANTQHRQPCERRSPYPSLYIRVALRKDF